MDEVDKFVQGGVFTAHNHTQTFIDGENKAAREAWLRKTEEICRRSGLAYAVREVTDEEGKPGYEFGFATGHAHAAFVFNIYGDLQNPGGHIVTHNFNGANREYRQAFLLAAGAQLDALGIDYRWREQDGSLQFSLDRFSDQFILKELIEQGTVDAAAKGLVSARAFQQRLGITPSSHSPWPGMDPG